MNVIDEPFEAIVSDLLMQLAPSHVPTDLVDQAERALDRTRRWPRWITNLKEPPMRHASRVVVGSPTARVAALAAVTLLVAILGAGALVAGAQSPTPDPRAAAYVTGTLGPVGATPDASAGIAENVTSSDPRLGGVYRGVATGKEYLGDMFVKASRTEIRDDDGAWVGTGTEAWVDGSLDDVETLVLAGEGAYAGLTAYLVLDWGTPGRPFKGVIFPGEMPEPPPAP